MTEPYTLTTHEVRDGFVSAVAAETIAINRPTREQASEGFERWLEKVRKDEHLTYRRVWYDAIVAETREQVARDIEDDLMRWSPGTLGGMGLRRGLKRAAHIARGQA